MEVEEAVRRMGLARTYRDRHWDRAVKVTDNAVQKAAPEWLEELLTALLKVNAPTYPMAYGFAVALRRLATAPGGPDRVGDVQRLAAQGKAWGEVRYELAEVAEWLAVGQPEEHLMAVFQTAQASDELAACLLQETALRYDATAAEPFAARLRAAGHPLADLPLRPTPAERGLGLPSHRDPSGAGHSHSEPGIQTPGIAVAATELEWPEANRALSAFRGWETEARLFRLERPVAAYEFGVSLLRGLGVPSAASGLAEARTAGTGDVLRTLFSGAASSGRRGAYGRLASWEALGALVGVPRKEAEPVAERSLWRFYTSDWHLRVHPSADVGIAALRPDRRTVAILAATNSD